MDQARTAVGMMMQNLEKHQQHLQREAKVVQLQIQAGKLVETQFAKEQILSELDTVIGSLETQLSKII